MSATYQHRLPMGAITIHDQTTPNAVDLRPEHIKKLYQVVAWGRIVKFRDGTSAETYAGEYRIPMLFPEGKTEDDVVEVTFKDAPAPPPFRPPSPPPPSPPPPAAPEVYAPPPPPFFSPPPSPSPPLPEVPAPTLAPATQDPSPAPARRSTRLRAAAAQPAANAAPARNTRSVKAPLPTPATPAPAAPAPAASLAAHAPASTPTAPAPTRRSARVAAKATPAAQKTPAPKTSASKKPPARKGDTKSGAGDSKSGAGGNKKKSRGRAGKSSAGEGDSNDDDQDDASAAGGVEDVDLDVMMATFNAEKVMYHDTQKKNKEKRQGKEKEAMAARSTTKGGKATTRSGAATTRRGGATIRRGGATTTSKSAKASAKGQNSTNEAPEPSTVAAGTKRKRDAADAATAAHDDDEDNRATKKARKMIIDLSTRIELFRTDRMVKEFTAHDVKCAACNTVIKTEPNHDFYFTNWDKHRFHCRRIAQWSEYEHAPSQEKLKEWQLGRNAIAEEMRAKYLGGDKKAKETASV